MAVFKRRVVPFLLLLILLLAGVFRFWDLGSHPPGLYHDEAYNGLDALSLLQGKIFPQFYEGWELYAADAHAARPPLETRFPIFFEGNYGREPLHIYLMAAAISLFGATPFAIRFVPAFSGVLAVLTTFLTAYAWIGNKARGSKKIIVPILAAFTLAVLYPAVHFSRFGIRAMVFVPIETMAVALFWWGINRLDHDKNNNFHPGTWIIFLLSGFFIGLGLYTFASSRVFPLTWIIFILLWLWQDRAVLRKLGPYLASMGVMALLIALPILWFFMQYPYYFFFRIAYVANKGKGAIEGKPWLTWIINVGRVIRGLLWTGETHLRHNLPGRPYLDIIQALLFNAGLIYSLRRIMNPRSLFLIIWFGVMLLPTILSGDAPHFGRLAGAAAPISILVGLGGYWLFTKLSKRLGKRYSEIKAINLGLIIITILFIISAFWTANDYFVAYAQHPDLARDFYEDDWQMGRFAADHPVETSIYLTPTQEELATLYFALEDPTRLRNYSGESGLIPTGIPGTPSLYLVRPKAQKSLNFLKSYFPDGLEGDARPGFIPFSTPGGFSQATEVSNVDFEFGENIRLIGIAIEDDGADLIVNLGWQVMSPVDQDFTVFVHLVTPDGQLISQVDRPPAGYPTSDWQSREIIVDRFLLQKPAEFDFSDSLAIQTGFYFLPTLERLGEPFTMQIE